MFVISAKILNDAREVIDWKYAGMSDDCAWWHSTHLSGTKFISPIAAEVWWKNHRDELINAKCRNGTLDVGSIGIRKICFTFKKRLK